MNESTLSLTQKSINQRFGLLINFLINSGRVKNESRVAQSIVASQAQVNRLAKGTGGNVSGEMLARVIQVYPDINPEWLMGLVEGPMQLEGNARGIGQALELDYVDLPFVRATMRASFIENMNTQIVETETIRVLYTPAKLYAKGVVFEVNGDSMEPYYLPGAKVLGLPLDQGEWQYLSSGVYAVAFGNYFVIKRVKNNEIMERGILTLHSDNTDGGSLPVRIDDIRAIWKIVKIVESPAR